MKSVKDKNSYIIRLERGENIIWAMKNFCKNNGINCGYFSGLGALDHVELAHCIVENKKYTSKVFDKPFEIANMTGNITMMDGEVYIHCHITLSDENMNAIAGHLNEGKISATCEIILVKLDAGINRKYDDFIGLNLM